MITAPIPDNEAERMQAVRSLNILDTPEEERFDAITRKAINYFHVPVSTISIIDSEREWFKSCQGVTERQGERTISFCGHAMLSQFITIVEDTLQDDRFKDNPQVTGEPFIRFYAGMALRERKSGHPVGVFCIKDTQPRQLNTDDIAAFMELANEAENELNQQAYVLNPQPTP